MRAAADVVGMGTPVVVDSHIRFLPVNSIGGDSIADDGAILPIFRASSVPGLVPHAQDPRIRVSQNTSVEADHVTLPWPVRSDDWVPGILFQLMLAFRKAIYTSQDTVVDEELALHIYFGNSILLSHDKCLHPFPVFYSNVVRYPADSTSVVTILFFLFTLAYRNMVFILKIPANYYNYVHLHELK
jgi:hypothetical protein